MPLNEDLQRNLYTLFDQAERRGLKTVEVSSDDLYRRTARLTPEIPHILISSAVMRSIAKPGDEIVRESSTEKVWVRYRLPRPLYQRNPPGA